MKPYMVPSVLIGVIVALAISPLSYVIAQDGPGSYRAITTFGRGSAYSLAWSPDGSTIAVGGALGIWLYTDELEDIALLTGHQEACNAAGFWGSVAGMAFSPDGSQLASAGFDGTVRLWDVTTQAELMTLQGHTGAVHTVAWSPDGHTVASGGDDPQVYLWDAGTGDPVQVLEGHSDEIRKLVWSVDGTTLFSGSLDVTIRQWDVQTGETVAVLEGHENLVVDLALSPDGTRLVSVGSYTMARLWDVKTGELLVASPTENDALYESVAWSPDGQQLAVAYRNAWGSGGVAFLDAQMLEWVGVALKSDAVRQVIWSPDGTRLATVGWNSSVQVWDATTGEAIVTQHQHTDGAHSLAWSPNGNFIASTEWRTLRVWDVATGQLRSSSSGTWDQVFISWSLDGRLITTKYGWAVGSCIVHARDVLSDHTDVLWDAQEGCEVAPSPDLGKLALVWITDGVRIIDPETYGQDYEPSFVLEGEQGPLIWSPDSRQLVTQDADGAKHIWDARSGDMVAELELPTGEVRMPRFVVWSPDGTWLAGTFGNVFFNQIMIWDAATGHIASEFYAGSERISLIVWHPDGGRIVGVARDGVRIWDVETSVRVAVLPASSGAIDWHPDGTRLAVANRNGTITIWGEE